MKQRKPNQNVNKLRFSAETVRQLRPVTEETLKLALGGEPASLPTRNSDGC